MTDAKRPVVGIAPGPERSGLVIVTPDLFDPVALPALVEAHALMRNELVADKLSALRFLTVVCNAPRIRRKTPLELLLWVGEFRHAARPTNRWHMAGPVEGSLATVRREVIARYAPVADPSRATRIAVGTEKFQGPLYGVDGHAWKALAVILTHFTNERKSDAVHV